MLQKGLLDGDSITYAYDALNQLTQKSYPGGGAAAFAYDKMGNMTSTTDSDRSVTFAYDNLYRLTGTTQQIDSNPAKTIEYEYDPAGNRTGMTGPDDYAVSYVYTLLNQVASVTDVYNNATNYFYDGAGRLTLRTYPNGTLAEFGYDDANRLTLLANKKSNDTIISSFDYEYDDAGNRTKRSTPSQALQYTYDNIYQVTEVYQLQPSLATLETFSYDDVGNRTSDVDYDDYSYNSNNQLTAYDSIVLGYDKNGNLTRKTQDETDVTTYTFDYENRLIRIDYPDETYSAYKYDPLGRRIEKRDRSGNIKRYAYDGQNFICEYDGNNSLLATYVQSLGIDQPISMFSNDEMYWYQSDALGSIYQMTDSAQNVVKDYDYSAFGKIISETGSLPFDNPISYTGREYDSDSGLYYYRARYYDAEVGRFLSRDPDFYLSQRGISDMLTAAALGLVLESSLTGQYCYVRNDPINFIDPWGEAPVRDDRDPDPRLTFCREIYKLKQERCYINYCTPVGTDSTIAMCLEVARRDYYLCVEKARKRGRA